MEADGLRAEEFFEGGGEDVLPGVLLAMVAAAGGVDAAVDFGVRREFAFDQVEDLGLVGGFLDGGNRKLAAVGQKDAGVEDLSAGGGIESGAVEDDGAASVVLADGDDGGIEFEQRGVVVVEAGGRGLVADKAQIKMRMAVTAIR